MPTAAIERSDCARSGGLARPVNAGKMGYLPVPLSQVPAGALTGVDVFVRDADEGAPGDQQFKLYRAASTSFAEPDRVALLRSGIELAYIRMSDQDRFRAQLDAEVQVTAGDPRVAIPAKATIVYETGVELINSLLGDADLEHIADRVRVLSRSIATVVLNDPAAFSHLFTASHHDFYTATHLVNVATYMVPLAYALGYRAADELNLICQAGLLHDIGKLYVPENVLNKPEQLSEEDWWLLERHPEMGYNHLRSYTGIDSAIARVAYEHHERLDGSGYPRNLRGDEMHPYSRLCAVIDAFDAMTALRPFKKRALTTVEAMHIIRQETPHCFDPEVVEAWAALLGVGETTCDTAEVRADGERRNTRRMRHSTPARIEILDAPEAATGFARRLQAMTHNVSATGIGLLSQTPLPLGARVAVCLQSRTWDTDQLRGQVVRCRAYTDGWYDVGVRVTACETDAAGDVAGAD